MHDLGEYLLNNVTGEAGTIFSNALRAVRTHLGMSVAFLSEFKDGRRFFRSVDCEAGAEVITPGASDPLDESLCALVVQGRLPALIPDACADAIAGGFDAVQALSIGAHISVPVTLANGRVYGTFCCFSLQPDPTLNERDVDFMRAFAEVVAKQVDKELQGRQTHEAARDRIIRVLKGDAVNILYQPMFNFTRGIVAGFEALSRFNAEPARSPDQWFAEAASAGLGIELELHAIQLALRGLDRLPHWTYISVNASPTTVASGQLARLLRAHPLDRITVEITEHEAIQDYARLAEELDPLRRQGLRLAIDDAGAGYACFQHVLRMAPDIVKLDISITRDIHLSRSHRALAAALCRFTEETGSKIIAEGVESALELKTLAEIGFEKAQGYHLGRPMTLDKAVELCSIGDPLPGLARVS